MERLKKTLNYVLSDCQTGFIKGRYVSESTRLIYDLLHAAENKNMPGMLMLIDFEKAFDSLSWSFLYSVLKFFGYSENFIKWVKLFNTEITAYIVQCGFLSRPIKTRLGQLGANISPDRSSLTPQVLIGNFLKHNYPLLYELQHINLLCLYLPRKMVYPQTPNT